MSLTGSPKKTSEEARVIVLDRLRRQHGPMLIGQAALDIGPYWRLNHAEELLEGMVEEGLLRRTTEEENRSFSIQIGYVLV